MADADPRLDPNPDFDHSHELISSTRVERTPIGSAGRVNSFRMCQH